MSINKQKAFYECAGMPIFEQHRQFYIDNYDVSCASPSQIAMLMGTIKDHKFEDGKKIKNVLEVGVCTGMTSYYMLKVASMNQNNDIYIYGIDINPHAGHLVRNYSSKNEIDCWRFYGGKKTENIEEILNRDEKLDMVFIDGMHAHPGPLIDFIYLYPFMRKDALVFFHDVDIYAEIGELGGAYFFSGWTGDKILNYNVDNNDFSPKNTEHMCILEINYDKIYDDLIKLAKLPITGCFYNYSDNNDPLGIEAYDIVNLKNFMLKFYNTDFANEFCNILTHRLLTYKDQIEYWRHQNRILHWSGLGHHGRLVNLENKLTNLTEALERISNLEKFQIYLTNRVNLCEVFMKKINSLLSSFRFFK